MHENSARKLHLLNIRDRHTRGIRRKNPSIQSFLKFKKNGANSGLIRACTVHPSLGSEPSNLIQFRQVN